MESVALLPVLVAFKVVVVVVIVALQWNLAVLVVMQIVLDVVQHVLVVTVQIAHNVVVVLIVVELGQSLPLSSLDFHSLLLVQSEAMYSGQPFLISISTIST